MVHILDCGVNPPKPEVPFSIATVQEKKSWAYDVKPVRKGSKKYKEVPRKPAVVTLLIYGKYESYKEFVAAVRERMHGAEEFDLRTIQFHESGSLRPEKKGVIWLDDLDRN